MKLIKYPIAALSTLAVAISAYGQDVNLLEEIIITAEKRTENLQDVPVAVTAFTSDTRDEVGITSIQDMTKFTPGLTYSTTLDRITLRGVGRFTNNLAADPGVAVYSDNFYTSSTTEAGREPIFVDRVEVLRGPQGTLYGRNSIGGAINIISKRPTEELFGEIRASYGDYDRQTLAGLISGPINENFRYLLGASTIVQDEGYFTNVNGGPSEGGVQDDQFYIVEFEANLGELDAFFKYQSGTWDQRRRSLTRPNPYDTTLGTPTRGGALLPTGSLIPSALYNSGYASAGASVFPLIPTTEPYNEINPGVLNKREFRSNTPYQVNLDDDAAILLDLTYHFDSVDVRYTGGYHTYLYVQQTDYDATDRESYLYTGLSSGTDVRVFTTIITEYAEDKEWMSHEVNISSTGSSDLQWLLGLYSYHEEYSQYVDIFSPDQPELRAPCISINYVSCVPGVTTPANPRGSVYNPVTDMDGNDSQAIYGQIDWALSDTLSTTLGLRYTKDEKDLTETMRYVRWDPTFAGPGAQAVDITRLLTANNDTSRRLTGDWSAASGTLGLEWIANDDSLGFAKYTRGYKSGGFNTGTIAAGAVEVQEEVIDAFEFGWKTTFDNNLQINSSLFYYDYQDFQSVVSVLPLGGGTLRSDFLNLPAAESYGLEFETLWAATDAMTILFNYSWQQSKIKDGGAPVLDSSDPTAIGPNAKPAQTLATVDPITGNFQVLQDISGNPMPGSPEHKLAANVRYGFDFGPGTLTLSVSDTWRSETNYSLFNDPGSTADSFNQVDARLLWVDSLESYTLIAFVQNLLDDEGFDGITDARDDNGEIFSSPGLTPPRTWGLEVQFRFGG